MVMTKIITVAVVVELVVMVEVVTSGMLIIQAHAFILLSLMYQNLMLLEVRVLYIAILSDQPLQRVAASVEKVRLKELQLVAQQTLELEVVREVCFAVRTVIV